MSGAVILTMAKFGIFLFFVISQGLVNAEEDHEDSGKELLKARVHFVDAMTSKVDAVCPLLRLRELESAGKQDLQAINEFSGPGDKRKARQDSLKFWSTKMQELVTPFVTKPEEYQGKLINFTYIPSDPKPSDIKSQNYGREEKSIDNLVSSTSENLERDYARMLSRRTDDVSGITQDSWWKFQLGKAFQKATFNINLWGQKAKYLAAAGKPYKPFLREHVEKETRAFYQKSKKQ